MGEKLHSALQRSHGNEKKLIIKCRELNEELISNASKVGTAIALSREDQNSIALLKTEIDKAWKMVDVAQDKEKKAKRTIVALRGEIQGLDKLVDNGLNIGQESTVAELLRLKEELTKEVECANKKMQQQLKEIDELNHELVDSDDTRCKSEAAMATIRKALAKTKQDLSRYSRRSERSEKQLLDIKSHLDETKLIVAEQKLQIKQAKNENCESQKQIKLKNENVNRQNHEFEALKQQCDELLQQLQIQKEKDIDIATTKQDVVNWRKEADKFKKCELNLKKRLDDANILKLKLKEEICQNKKDLLAGEKDRSCEIKKIAELNLQIKKSNSQIEIEKRKNCELQSEIGGLATKCKELTSDLSATNQKLTKLKKHETSLEKKTERLAANENEWHSKNKKM